MEADGGHLSVSPGQKMAAATSGETGSGTLDGLVALVGGINEALNGDSSAKTAPVYAAASINTPEASTTASASTAPIAPAGASASNVAPLSPATSPAAAQSSPSVAASEAVTASPSFWDKMKILAGEVDSAYREEGLESATGVATEGFQALSSEVPTKDAN